MYYLHSMEAAKSNIEILPDTHPHLQQIWKRRQKECKSQMMGRSAVKCWVLATAWLMHSLTHSNCGYLHSTYTKFRRQNSHMGVWGAHDVPFPNLEQFLAAGERRIILYRCGHWHIIQWKHTHEPIATLIGIKGLLKNKEKEEDIKLERDVLESVERLEGWNAGGYDHILLYMGGFGRRKGKEEMM